jgi:sugar phosphate isomerase/epimerase
MHPRISLHQVAFMGETTAAFIAHCRAIGVGHMTLVTPKLMQSGDLASVQAALAAGGPRVAAVNHVFAVHPNLEDDSGEAARRLNEAIAISAALGAKWIYLISGGRGSLSWEEAAVRFAALIAPCKALAAAQGIGLLVENAQALNVDIHMAHTFADTIRLAAEAGIGVCLDLHGCWTEAQFAARVQKAMPMIGLVQVSDYVLGDRTTPCRAVPGDGAIPLERLIGEVLEAGYGGVFDLELIGPRIEAEGHRPATLRAAEILSEILVKLGA